MKGRHTTAPRDDRAPRRIIWFHRESMLRNTALMLLATVARLLSGALAFIWIARAWGPEQFGAFMFPFTIASIGVHLVDYGFGLQIVRDVSRRPAAVHELTATGNGVKLLLTGALAALTPLIAHYTGGEGAPAGLLWLLMATAVLNSFGLFLNYSVRGLGRFDVEARVATWSNLAHLALVGLALWLRVGLLGMGVTFVVARLLNVALCVWSYRTATGALPRLWGGWPATRAALRTGLPFGIHITVGTLYFQLDTVYVQHYLGTVAVGNYQAAIRILMAALILPEVLSNVYLPAIARHDNTREDMRRLGTDLARFLIIAGAAGLVVLTLARQPIVQLLYGSRYDQVAPLLPLFGVVLLVRYFGASFGLLLTVADRQTVRTIAVIGAVGVSALANWLLIPRFGLEGAAAAAIVTNVVLAGVYVAFVMKDFRALLVAPRARLVLASMVAVPVAALIPVNGIVLAVLMLGLIAALGFQSADWEAFRARAARFSGT